MKIILAVTFLVTLNLVMGSLSSVLRPVTSLLAPTLHGADTGLQQNAANLKAAVANAGAAVDQIANGLTDVGANTLAGAGRTIGRLPEDTLKTAKNLSS